jgi:hypothetical protein
MPGKSRELNGVVDPHGRKGFAEFIRPNREGVSGHHARVRASARDEPENLRTIP